MLAQDDYFARRKGAAESASGFKAIERRHANVHDDDIGPQFASLLDGVTPIHGFAAYRAPGNATEQTDYASSDHFMVIDH
jgi:hypothetical protein